jgi:hypothetical protein
VSELWKNLLPLHKRTFLETLFGSRAPITENDLTKKEQRGLRSLVDAAEKKAVGYEQQKTDNPRSYFKMVDSWMESIPALVGIAKTDPDWQEMARLRGIPGGMENLPHEKFYEMTERIGLRYGRTLGQFGASWLAVAGGSPDEIEDFVMQQVDMFTNQGQGFGVQEELQQAKESAVRNPRAGGHGSMQYEDYDKNKNYPRDLALTFGRFSYSPTQQGGTRVTDRYDFDNEFRRPAVEEYEKMGTLKKAAAVARRFYHGAPLASELGNAYIGKEGRKAGGYPAG